MRTFKRKLHIQPNNSKSKKIWQSFIKQELQSINLKYLMQLTEKTNIVLNNLELIDVEYTKHYVMLSFMGFNNTSLYIRKWDHGEIETMFFTDSDFDYTPDELIVMGEVVKRAPVYMLYYLKKHLQMKTKKQLNCSIL